MNNKQFSLLVQKLIAENMEKGMGEDEAVASAYDCARKQIKQDSIARLTREMKFYYLDGGKWVPKIKSFEELKKAVDELNGRPLPTYEHHDDSVDLDTSTGIYYHIVADATTKSVYGVTYPDHAKGTMNSIGFTCDEVTEADGQTYQTNIHLDHVAVSSNLVGRGGETVAVIDEVTHEMVEKDQKAFDALQKEVEAKEAALKAKADEIERMKVDADKALGEARKAKETAEAEAKAAKDALDKIHGDERDKHLAYCKARMKSGTTVSLDEIKTLEAAKWLHAYTDAITPAADEQSKTKAGTGDTPIFGGDEAKDSFPFTKRPSRGTI